LAGECEEREFSDDLRWSESHPPHVFRRRDEMEDLTGGKSGEGKRLLVEAVVVIVVG
jgi:hypothetical protein